MLTFPLLHPELLSALGRSGHGSRILIADGNYPFSTRANPAATRVFLNLAPGLLSVTDVLAVLLRAIPVEAAHVMTPDDGIAPDICRQFRELLPPTLELQKHTRFPFYDLARDPDCSLVIATGEQRIYANILLVIGVVT